MLNQRVIQLPKSIKVHDVMVIIKLVTQKPLGHRVALLNTELEGDGGGAAGQAHGADAEDVESDLEAELILYDDHFLRDEGDDDAENQAS